MLLKVRLRGEQIHPKRWAVDSYPGERYYVSLFVKDK
jgi:hypothetical protein